MVACSSRPYGVACSGFVDWVFYNATNDNYIIGHGGGAMSQHSYCTPISWDDALPGDLVFYPDDSHVGIVGGRDTNGDLLIIHCASGYNKINGMSHHLRPMPPLSDGVGLIFSYAVGGTAGRSRTRNQSHPIICRWIWRLPVPSIAGTIEKMVLCRVMGEVS